MLGDKPEIRRLNASAVPSVFPWTEPPSQSAVDRQQRAQRRSQNAELQTAEPSCDSIDIEECLNVAAYECVETPSENTSDDSNEDDEYIPIFADNSCQTTALPRFSIENFVNDPAAVHFYTGLENYEQFQFVLSTLGPAAYHLQYQYDGYDINVLSVADKFFLTLLRLRRYTTLFELSRMFETSEATGLKILVTWINFMYYQWKEIEIWPSKELVSLYAPSDFKQKFPSTRVIVDGTECPVRKPKGPKAQQATFSTYKNRNTVKVLVGCTPAGLVSYISPAYGGCTSDHQIVERSNLPMRCDSGDSVMADKGFNVQDLFAHRNVTINIPTFFRNKNRLPADVVLRDRRVSSKRVHIERIIGLAKTYRILTTPMNTTESALASEILYVCFFLCNLRSRIVPRTA